MNPVYQRNRACIVLEYIAGGSLFDYVKRVQNEDDQEIVRFYFRQMLDAVDFMHQRGICHRDLKVENFLVDIHNQYGLRIIDFGMSKTLESL